MSSVFGLDLQPSRAGSQGDMSQASLGSVSTFHIEGDSQELRRTYSAIECSGLTPVKVCAVKSGNMVLARDGEEDLHFQPGDIAIYDTGIPYRLSFEGQWNCSVMTVEREELSLPRRVLDNALRRSYPGVGTGNLLTQLIESSLGQGNASPSSAGFLGHAAIDLLAGLVYEKSTPQAPDEALRVAVVGFIRENLSNSELSAEYVAHAQGISVRTLHRLFHGEQWGVAELIRNFRLDAVHRDLMNPRLRDLTILSIGVKHGIGSQAQLTRLFRSKYGITPGAFRREHVPEG